MYKLLTGALAGLLVLSAVVPEQADAQRRRTVVVRRGPVRRTTIVVRPGHPIRRALPRTVVFRPARKVVVVGRPLVFLPALAWTAAVVATLPAENQLLWEDAEVFSKDEEWVDLNFGVDQRGTALLLDVDGRAQLSFAEVTFENGDVQVVDFNDTTHGKGLYNLLDYKDGRRVMTVRILARSETPETTLRVYLRT